MILHDADYSQPKAGTPIIPFKDYITGQWVDYVGHIADMTFAQALRLIPQNENARSALRFMVDHEHERPGAAVMAILAETYDT